MSQSYALLVRVMHIYRFFHPHYNPRLLNRALRGIEISELYQAASELRKALSRSLIRTQRNPEPQINTVKLQETAAILELAEKKLLELYNEHEGDSQADIDALAKERAAMHGWETWTQLVREVNHSHKQRLNRASRN